MESSGPHDLPSRTPETDNPRSFASPLFAKFEVFLFLPPPKRLDFCVGSGLWIGGIETFCFTCFQKNCSSAVHIGHATCSSSPGHGDASLCPPNSFGSSAPAHETWEYPPPSGEILESRRIRELCHWMCSSLWRQRKMVNLTLGHELEILGWSIVTIIIMKHEWSSSWRFHSHRRRVSSSSPSWLLSSSSYSQCWCPINFLASSWNCGFQRLSKFCSYYVGSCVWKLLQWCGTGCTCPYWFTSRRYGSLNSFWCLSKRMLEVYRNRWLYILVRQTERQRGAAKAAWKFRTLSRWSDVMNQQAAFRMVPEWSSLPTAPNKLSNEQEMDIKTVPLQNSKAHETTLE